MTPAFSIDFEELPLEIDGKEAGMFWGTAHFDARAVLIEIDITKEDRSGIELTPERTSLDLLSQVIKRRCGARILDAYHDYYYSSREQARVDEATFRRSA